MPFAVELLDVLSDCGDDRRVILGTSYHRGSKKSRAGESELAEKFSAIDVGGFRGDFSVRDGPGRLPNDICMAE